MRREHPILRAAVTLSLTHLMVWGGVPAAALAQMAGEAPDASIEAVSPAGADEPGEALEPDGGAVEEDGQAATGDAPELTVGDAPELAAPGGDGELRGPDPEIEEEIEEGPEAGAAASEDAVVEELAACGDGSAPLEADALEPEPDGDPAVEPDGLGAQAAKRASISGARVAKVAAQPFTGKAVRPSPKVTFGGATLRKGVDYVLSYRNNKRPGRATIEVRGKGAYAGTKRVGFRIVAPSVTYRVHVQTYGDQSARGDGAVAGTSGEAKRLEAIWVSLGKGFPVAGGIRYRTHVQSYGWMPWKGNGQKSGTSGEGKRLEAIEVELTGGMARKYDVWYRVHAQHFGWMGWAKNGASAGTQGFAYRLEAIQVVLLPKGSKAPAATYRGAARTTATAFLKWKRQKAKATSAQAVLDFARQYDPDAHHLLNTSYLDGEDILKWWSDDGKADMASRYNTAVHEECHHVSFMLMSKERIYLGNGKAEVVTIGEHFNTVKMAPTVPRGLRTARYDIYIAHPDDDLASNVDGVYGLLNELTAYCWDTTASLRLYDYYAQLDDPTAWRDYFAEIYSTANAYAEFRFFIEHYLWYAKKHDRATYDDVMANESFLNALKSVDKRFASTIKTADKRIGSVARILRSSGWSLAREGDALWFRNAKSGGSLVIGVQSAEYNRFAKELAKPRYKAIESALGLKAVGER